MDFTEKGGITSWPKLPKKGWGGIEGWGGLGAGAFDGLIAKETIIEYAI